MPLHQQSISIVHLSTMGVGLVKWKAIKWSFKLIVRQVFMKVRVENILSFSTLPMT